MVEQMDLISLNLNKVEKVSPLLASALIQKLVVKMRASPSKKAVKYTAEYNKDPSQQSIPLGLAPNPR